MGSMDWTHATLTQGFGPTDEPLDSGYNGYAHFNKGYDYGVPVGTPIGAAAGGTVLSAGDSGDGWGISVKVVDSEGNTHNYGHLSSVNVQPGDVVYQGDVIGNSGNSGNSTGPHLSYDVWDRSGAFFDPGRFVSGAQAPGVAPTRGGTLNIPGSDASGTAAAEGDATSPDDPASIIEGWNTTLLQRINALTVTSPEVVQAAKDGGTTPQDALAQIQQTLMAQYASNAATVKSFRDYSSGIYTMPGTNYAVPIDTLPPEVQDAIKQNNDSVYREFLNKSIVDSYNLHADAATAKFNAALSKLNASQTYDTNAVARANAEISRQLGGMAESRSRAQYISDFLAKMAPWTTAPGKSSFTAGDLGMGTLAGMLGIGNAPVVNYTGTQTVDPAALMEGYDSKLGVGGPLPQIPAGITNPDDILGLALNLPDVPDLQMPGAPNFQMPAARTPATVGAPGSSANGLLPTDWSNPSTLFVGGPDPNRGPDPANTPWAVKDDGSGGGGGGGLGIGWTLPGDLIQNGLEGIINRFWG